MPGDHACPPGTPAWQGLLEAAKRHGISERKLRFRPGFWVQGQSNWPTPF